MRWFHVWRQDMPDRVYGVQASSGIEALHKVIALHAGTTEGRVAHLYGWHAIPI
jgi:hypothetical protein